VKVVHGRAAGRPPRLDLDAEKRLHRLLAEAAAERLVHSAHDASEGGLAVAVAECCFRGEEPGLGGRFELDALPLVLDGPQSERALARPDVLLFSETPSRAVVTTRDEPRLRELASRHGVRWARLGIVGGDRLTFTLRGRTVVDAPVAALHEAWMSLERVLGA
jgi:phosphoribosylformylglycinamidine synthase